MRRSQLILAVLLAIEAAAVIFEANVLAQKLRVTDDGDILPPPWTYPSVFSAGGALTIAVVVAAFVVAASGGTRKTLTATVAIFIFGSLGLWSFHRLLVWLQGISGHGLPGWW